MQQMTFLPTRNALFTSVVKLPSRPFKPSLCMCCVRASACARAGRFTSTPIKPPESGAQAPRQLDKFTLTKLQCQEYNTNPFQSTTAPSPLLKYSSETWNCGNTACTRYRIFRHGKINFNVHFRHEAYGICIVPTRNLYSPNATHNTFRYTQSTSYLT